MGELADDVADAFRDARRTGYHRGLTETHQDLVDRIEQLEARVDLETPIDVEILADRADVADRADLARRLADAEQRAAAAWAAVTAITSYGVQPLVHRHLALSGGYREVIEQRNGNDVEPAFRIQVTTHQDHAFRGLLVVFEEPPRNAPANPDLLERASVELAEAYQRAKAEADRTATFKAAMRGPANPSPPPADGGG